MTRITALIALLILAVSGGALGASIHYGDAFTVRSSLGRGKVLRHRIRWSARPSLAASNVTFLIDGRTRWIAHEAPYSYAAQGGYLVTSFLKPGMHRFTVRATAYNGLTATDTVVARVTPTPEPPAELAGTWQRTIDTSGAPAPGSSGNPTYTLTPPGTYSLSFEKRWIRDDFPGRWVLPRSNETGEGNWYLSDYSAEPGRFRVQGAVVARPYNDQLAGVGAWCYFWGPTANYTWTVTGDTLTLAPVGGKDACAIRGFIWAGEWGRAG